ncbi:MAG: hypothetical protein Q9209_001954 [Squamulea sp. 1 TL-2023]
MFVKLPTFVVVAVTAGFCLGAPTSEETGLSVREPKRHPGLEGYPKCGAPICKRDGGHLGFLDDAEVNLGESCLFVSFDLEVNQYSVNRAAETCKCAEGKLPFFFHGHCQCSGDKLNYTRTDVAAYDSQLSDGKRDLERRIRCAVINCPRYRERVILANGHCYCAPQGHIPQGARPAALKRDAAGSESVQTDQVEQAVPQKPRRNAQDDYNASPLDCASIAKCPANQHPVNNASDGMCECVDDDDDSDNGTLDCAAIAKCPGEQHPVFNNNAGQCECIPNGTQLDCVSISQCSDGAHPINYNGMCICVPNNPNQKMARHFSVAGTSSKLTSSPWTTVPANTTVPASPTVSATSWPTGPPKQGCTIEEDPGCYDAARCIPILDPGCTDPGRYSVQNFAGHCICRPNCTATQMCPEGLCAFDVQVGNCGCYLC